MRKFIDPIQHPIITEKLLGDLIQDEPEEETETFQARADVIREAQDAWSKLNSCLHFLGPLPPGVLEGWDRIKPWLNQQGQDVTYSLNTSGKWKAMRSGSGRNRAHSQKP
jgi:hypothetical protein